jgi:DNA-binding NtrC family response regulator
MKTILIVEDDDSTATFLTLAIAQETSYQVLHATTGVRALEIVRHIKAGLFIIDYLLPDMNGIVLYDYLHALEGLEAVPAIILTAISLERLREEIQQRHLLSLAKPFDLDTLLETIAFALTVFRHTAEIDR